MFVIHRGQVFVIHGVAAPQAGQVFVIHRGMAQHTQVEPHVFHLVGTEEADVVSEVASPCASEAFLLSALWGPRCSLGSEVEDVGPKVVLRRDGGRQQATS